jgi:ABC-type branched-subunit amino acid transport system substrate-binding protein
MHMNLLLFYISLLTAVSCPIASIAQADDRVTVGAIFAKSGEAAEDNLELFEAVRFAVDEVNAKGGIHGKKIKLVEYDNHSTPIQSKLAAKQAVREGAIAVIGASWSSHSLAIAPYLQKMQVPMISPDSTHPDVTKTGDYIFRACFNDAFQGKVLAMFARNTLKTETAVVIRNITNGGQDLDEGYYTAHWSKELDTEKTKEFISRYKKTYEVSEFAAISYDAAMLLFDAMQRAESLDRHAIRDALAETRDFDGVTGKISFDENGDPVKRTVVMKITDGRPALFMTIAAE